ncbi:GspH/FimT family pseudopilin [Pelagibaculum spongiae]|uniref:Type II secretion system protein H n=1 Tax=Pelagibaculum spongiae TaxID=2080658 RepID=A0A2V1H5R7_9GAMM|nr:GspH/FimT family pseudopilin [Pelagibaculum spongiae]PVZ72557.1 hypothetical protein DC094_00440 [Pelagibaculum spongiae]
MVRSSLSFYYRDKKQTGVTLVELMVTIAVLSILSAIAIPSFSSILDSSASEEQTRELVRLLNYARTEAVRRNEAVSVQPISATATSADWEKELVVFVNDDRTGAGLYSNGQTILRQHAADRISDVSITTNNNNLIISFAPSGMLVNSQQALVFKVCGKEKHRQLNVSRSGLVNSGKLSSC